MKFSLIRSYRSVEEACAVLRAAGYERELDSKHGTIWTQGHDLSQPETLKATVTWRVDPFPTVVAEVASRRAVA